MHTIGYIGLGAMGASLAGRLARTCDLRVWDLNRQAIDRLVAQGARAATSAADLARQCDSIVLCLPRSADVHTVVFGPEGLVQELRAGHLLIDQTSGTPEQTRIIATRLAERGVHMLDAPVSGGVAGAREGTIAIMASGDDTSYAMARPILEAISTNVFRCGHRVGDGQAMKLVNNMLSAGTRLATLEIVAVGRKMGLSLAAMTDVINKGSGRNRTTKVMLQKMVDGKPSASSFAMALMVKDMNQAIQLGTDCGVPTTITNAVRGLLQIGVSTLGAQAQLEDILGVIETHAGIQIADKTGAPATEHTATVIGEAPLRVGYVGLGVMGGALARRMMRSMPIRVFDARPEVVATFAAEGALTADGLPSLARECDVIITCLPTSSDVETVIFGKGGLAESLSPGKIIVDQTTGDPSITRNLSERLAPLGVAMVDAPVSGGPRGAVAGTIGIFCGGPHESNAKVRPLLVTVSPNIVHCGAVGNGHAAKLIQNAVASCNRLLTYEAASVGVKYGLTLAALSTVINASTGWSGATERILPALSEQKATADFQLQLMLKDLNLMGRMAMDAGAPMLIGNTVRNLFQAGVHAMGGSNNLDAMAKFFESLGGVQFRGA